MTPLIDTTTRQAAGQTMLEGLGPDAQATAGNLTLLTGGPLAVSALRDGEIVLDKAAADKLGAQAGDTVRVVVAGRPQDLRVRAVVLAASPSTQFPVAFVSLSQMQALYHLPGQISTINLALQGDLPARLAAGTALAPQLRRLLGPGFQVDEARQSALTGADQIGNIFTSIFVGTSLFSIAAGVLLIFLVFAMLAAERKSEMGMARAVGTQRGHLTQMFIFEGLAYDLGAAAVGTALGVLVGFAMVGVISGLLGNYGFQLVPHMELRSIVVAYCLGMLVTFFTVAISAARVSRLNIVAAIRDLPDAPRPEQRLRARLTAPFRLLFGEFRPLGCLGALFALAGSLLASGPISGGLGALLLAAGWVGKNGFLFHTGASLTIIAIGLTLRWLLRLGQVRPARRDRIAYSVMGLGLLAYWALPVDTLHHWIGVPAFGAGIEIFFVGGMMMVAGAVWTIIYNSDLLLGLLTFALGRVGRLRPVLKTAVAYPMAATFRTGMAIAMFALIMFVLIVMSVLTQLNAQFDPAKPEATGGYQIQATVPFANPIRDLPAQVAANPALQGQFTAIAGETLLPLQFHQPGEPPPLQPYSEEDLRNNPGLAAGWHLYVARVVDPAFLADNQFKLAVRARGYASDRAVWDAIAKDPTLAVVDSLPVLVGKSTAGLGSTLEFGISGVDPAQPVMDPVSIAWQLPGGPGSPTGHVTVIGVLSQDASFYPGMYLSQALAARIMPGPLPVTNYFFRVRPGTDPAALRRALGSAFLESGLEPVVLADSLRQQQAVGDGLTGLLQGFMMLGLLVGIAALGVISTRAVVERRQQIGVLRAIGYQRGMVAGSFLLESSFVALLGIGIGVVLGLVLSYNLVQFLAKDQPTLQFTPPWLEILGIVVLAYVASLLTTILPARSAASIYPAEALRYI